MRRETRCSLKHGLQLRFVLLATLAAATLLSVVVGVVLLRSYNQIVRKADHLLDVLQTDADSAELGDVHYFTITFSASDRSAAVDISHTGLVRERTALGMGHQVLKSGETRGFLEGYRYRVTQGAAKTQIVFLSRKLPLDTFQDTRKILIGVSLLGLALSATLLALLSGRVVAPLVEADEKQKAFITSASHALKTPVAVILGEAQLLQMTHSGNEWLCDIEKQAKHLTEMTQSLVTLSRCDEGSRQSSFLPFPISDVAEDVALSFRARATGRNQYFQTEITPHLSYCGDEKALREMMAILLDNAIRYCPEQGSIFFSLEKKRRGISLVVQNTAENIQKEELSHFTERFYRGSTAGTTPGSGLGLAIAQSIVQRHHGRITVSAPGNQEIAVCITL